MLIDDIASAITDALSGHTPFPSLPSLTVGAMGTTAKGLSAMELTSDIISRLETAGIPTGPNADGSENSTCRFVRIFCEELVKEIKDNAVALVSFSDSPAHFVGVGANAAGPVTAQGSTAPGVSMKGLVI